MKIVVANSKGGSGKSTLVLALADMLPGVQVIDLDGRVSAGNFPQRCSQNCT